MTCTNCGDAPLAMEYTIRCTPSDRSDKVLQLYLCHDCLYQICADPDVELLTEETTVTSE
jgi:hypothetical protein